MGRSRDQVLGLENAVCRGLRYKIPFLIGVFDGQFPWRQILMIQRELNEGVADLVRDAVPHRPRPRGRVTQSVNAAIGPPRIPLVIGAAGNAEHGQGPPDRQMRGFDCPNDLELLRGWVSHASSSPSPNVLFLSSLFSSVSSATTSFSAAASERSSLTSGAVA